MALDEVCEVHEQAGGNARQHAGQHHAAPGGRQCAGSDTLPWPWTRLDANTSGTVSDRRRANLRAALGFLQIAPRAPGLPLLHRWLDSWTGLGLVVVGVERQGVRFSLSHIGEAEWRAYLMRSPLFAPEGFGVASTPWQAVQRTAWAVLKRGRYDAG